MKKVFGSWDNRKFRKSLRKDHRALTSFIPEFSSAFPQHFVRLDSGGCVADNENVIDTQHWLFDHAERLLEQDAGAAIPYLERLLVSSEDRLLRIFCLKNLGLLHLGEGELDEARKYLRAAVELSPRDAVLHHALGQIAATSGNFWLALLEFMEAVYHGRDDEVVGFMRSVAATLRQLQFGETALAILLGAYERNPEDPWVLDSLGRMYESEQRWLDAIEAREHLVEVLESNRFLGPKSPEDARLQIEKLTSRMRAGMRLIEEPEPPRGPFDVQRTSSPAGLHTLVRSLGLREHNSALLSTAEALWARAHYAKLDVHLSVPTLAAAIHWVVERLHWRVPTTLDDLAALYGADSERLRAAVRLVVACLDVELVSMKDAEPTLPPADLQRLQRLQRANSVRRGPR